MTKTTIIAFACIIYIAAAARAQNNGLLDKRLEAGFSQYSSLTSTGINTGFLLYGRYGRHVAYAGPKIGLSSSYIPGNMSWGYDMGYKYIIFYHNHWAAYLILDYQNILSKPYSAYGISTSQHNSVNEVFFANGIEYYAGRKKNVAIGLHMGIGPYIERYYDVVEGSKSTNTGVAQMVRLNFSYNLFNK